MRKILAVDDDPDIAAVIEEYFDRPDYEVCTLLEGKKVLETVSKMEPDLIVLDLKLPDLYGVDILKELRKRDRRIPVVIITGNVSAGAAIESMKEGACEYLPKPFKLEELGQVVNKLLAKESASQASSTLQNDYYEAEETEKLVGRSSEILKVGKIIGQAASSEAPVLVIGESGSGKGRIAKIIHQNSRRKDKPFIAVNCAYVPSEMLEQELFGQITRVGNEIISQGRGKFELCNGGTILLEYIGSMRLSTQAKVLRALKKGEMISAGGKTVDLDVRIIATSTLDLSKSVAEDKFMQELFYNLRVISIFVPPLKERKSDIPLLAGYFLNKYRQEGKNTIFSISPDAMKLLMGYSWPGNIRELENNVYSAMEMCQGSQILPEHLPIFFEREAQRDSQKGKDDYSYLFMQTLDPIRNKIFQDSKGKIHNQLTGSLERALITIVLRHCQGNQVKAADLLGISRNTLRERMLKFGLRRKERHEQSVTSEP